MKTLNQLIEEATPLPLSNAGETVYAVNTNGVSDEWASCAAGHGMHFKKAARAALIAHCVNNFAEVVEALRIITSMESYAGEVMQIVAATALAKATTIQTQP